MKKYQHYINGEWLDTSDKEIIPVLNPANEELIGEITCGKEADINHAVDAAKKAYNSRILVDMNPMERAKLMRGIAEELRKISKEGGALLCAENGKLLSSSINEFYEAANYFDYYSGLTDKIEGQTIPVNSQVMDYTIYEPYGVSGHIVPWNFPISMVARSLACSFAAGNSTVIKPAELTPLATHSFFAQAIHNAGVPAGLINIVTGYGNEAGAALTAHPDVAQITFTGSVNTGKTILRAAAERAVPAVVELGGKSAAVVLPDADIDKVVNATKIGIFSQAGQICSAMSRMIVHKSIKQEVLDKLSKLAGSIKVGPGDEEGVDLTPVISEEQLQKIENYARSGLQAGANVISGGNRIDRKGYFFEPTIYSDVKPEMTIAQEEIFGPFLSVLDYEDHEEAVHIANDTEYGLAAGVFTRDVDMATKTASLLNGGQVYVNSWFTGSIATPFGGYKQSGYSREKGQQAIKSYLQLKNIGIQL